MIEYNVFCNKALQLYPGLNGELLLLLFGEVLGHDRLARLSFSSTTMRTNKFGGAPDKHLKALSLTVCTSVQF